MVIVRTKESENLAVKINEGFSLVTADNPWPYDNNKDHRAELGGTPYLQMSIRDICALRPLIDKVVAKDSVLLLWATMPKLPEALQVMASWGYVYVCCPWVWVKLNPTGELWQPAANHVVMNATDGGEAGGVLRTKDIVLKGGVYSGMGSYTAGNVELLLMGKRGRGCTRQAKNIKQIVFAPRGAHSSKPEEVRNRIDQVWPGVPKLELFARPPVRVKSWLKLGNEISGNDIREDLQQLAAGNYTIPNGG